MKRKLNCVLLVDDDDMTNFLNRRVLEQYDCTHTIEVAENGEKALEYLTQKTNEGYPSPDLILLDINMPRMNGWEFLEEYTKLNDTQKGEVVIVMLTTSLNPDDKTTAENNDEISDFINKPLTPDELKSVLEKHFDLT
jgi:CheY-like chemotaxis protein